MPFFELLKTSSKHSGRVGKIITPHGTIDTPAFMPVGTQATIKGLRGDQILETGAHIILANTYHLYLRPGIDTIERAGGLHAFMNCTLPILTDSGGFQVFSLGGLRRIMDNGVVFKSHHDGSEHLLTPESVLDIQRRLGSDIIMPLDVCVPATASLDEVNQAVSQTTQWAQRSHQAWTTTCNINDQHLFGIIQGGLFKDERYQSANELMNLDFSGYAIGGLSVGEEKPAMYDLAAYCASLLPKNKPRYLMGVGDPNDIRHAIESGIDMFDCVLPTRLARHGTVFTKSGRLNIKAKIFEHDYEPIEASCDCYTCKNHTRSYIRHLFRCDEMLGKMLMTMHNVHFLVKITKEIRLSILKEDK